ncbi:spermidine synthase [Geothermobacter hydrogeniphilus]|uniref:Spermidine synthase n=1 Tax=Geothermobacter hydrogeniphilus TaxID=1969733 RepID=A0A1X0YBN9_9BACT|nr:spermidine synthase [Geothermobacter hydrogeniphilus]ORJ62503.1 spermidine synthase [Geothermobacter hydrogeniphilus]
MARPWIILDRFEVDGEGTLELRRRGDRDFLIAIGPQILMNSSQQLSEVALGRLGCAGLRQQSAPRVLIGGLGMGITLRAALDELPADAEVVVAELNPRIVDWCRGPLADLTAGAVLDERVKVHLGDVTKLIAETAAGDPGGRFDAIILDLYRGPHAGTDRLNDPIYGSWAIERSRDALRPGGIFAVWGENYDAGFSRRLTAAGFAVRCERPGRGGYRHAVFLAQKA